MVASSENKAALTITDDTRDIETNRVGEKVQLEENTTIIQTRSIAGDVLIWGNSTFGMWNSFKWGNAANTSFVLGNSLAGILGTSKLGSQLSSYVTQSIVNPNNRFREHFKDTSFEDTGVTTADWSDTSSLLKFTIGEIGQSTSIAYGNGTISQALLNLTISTGVIGDLTTQLSADGGSNWETVTPGTTHTFTNTGTDLRFKFTASGTIDLSLVQIEYT